MLQNVIILLIVSAVMCSIGFYKHVYFLSIGYGFSVAGIGAALLIMYASSLNIFSVLQCIVLILYGARLAGFLLYRELKNAAYRSTLKSVAKDESDMSFAAKFGIWAGVAILYVMETSPVFFRLVNGTQDTAAPVIGICISLFGLFMEAAADHQKSEQKKENPHMAAMKGLYRIVRCPNYFGEILFWTGVMAGGLTSLHGAVQWITALTAYAMIIGIMISGAARLEKRQNSNYGKDPVYQAYTAKTPVLFPWVPLYHLTKEQKHE